MAVADGLLALLGALILLALPASNAFFRKRRPAGSRRCRARYPGYPSSGTTGPVPGLLALPAR